MLFSALQMFSDMSPYSPWLKVRTVPGYFHAKPGSGKLRRKNRLHIRKAARLRQRRKARS